MSANQSVDVVALTQLVSHERQGRDRGRWQQMRECLAPDAYIALSWFRGSGTQFIDASERMAAAGTQATHRLGAAVVDVVNDRALVEVPASIEVRDVLDGVELDLTSYTRLIYRAERREGRWWLVSLDSIYERDTIQPTVPGTTIHVDPKQLAGFRHPYRLLAYFLAAKGFEVRDDVYGVDRPAQIAELYDRALHWLRIGEPRREP